MRHIVITAGHSNTDPGAVGNGATEAEIVTDFRNLVAYYLRAAEVPFTADGEDTRNLPLAQAVRLIKPGSLAVEFHCNSFSSPTASGVETLSGSKDFEFGADLCAAIAGVLGITNRGAKAESSGQHSRLAFVRAGGLICELFFISNPDDLNKYRDKKWVVAREVSQVILRHAKL